MGKSGKLAFSRLLFVSYTLTMADLGTAASPVSSQEKLGESLNSFHFLYDQLNISIFIATIYFSERNIDYFRILWMSNTIEPE